MVAVRGDSRPCLRIAIDPFPVREVPTAGAFHLTRSVPPGRWRVREWACAFLEVRKVAKE